MTIQKKQMQWDQNVNVCTKRYFVDTCNAKCLLLNTSYLQHTSLLGSLQTISLHVALVTVEWRHCICKCKSMQLIKYTIYGKTKIWPSFHSMSFIFNSAISIPSWSPKLSHTRGVQVTKGVFFGTQLWNGEYWT